MTWQVLDASSIWMKEFASALSGIVPVRAWIPQMTGTALVERWERDARLSDPLLDVSYFPLQRGYSRFPFSLFTNLGPRMASRMARRCVDPRQTPLICTTPFYAPVAENWPGPVIYYMTDYTVAYAGLDPDQVRALDRRFVAAADLICPNSRRIADYMTREAGCDPDRIRVIPNATRACNVLAEPPSGPGPLPADIAGLPRPIAGIIGNLAANMDWNYLAGVIERTPEFSWVFVGPSEMPVFDKQQLLLREKLRQRGGRVRFVGMKPYGELRDYARAFDVAMLPYRRHEPTYSGSATRFYEHLAACRPMVATRGQAELLEKEPLLILTDTPDEAAAALHQLHAAGFCDGQEIARWEASLQGTWEERARTMRDALASVPACGELICQ